MNMLLPCLSLNLVILDLSLQLIPSVLKLLQQLLIRDTLYFIERDIPISFLGATVVPAFHGAHHLLMLLVDLLHLSPGIGQLDLQELDLLLSDGFVLEGLVLLGLGLFLNLLELSCKLIDMIVKRLDSFHGLLMGNFHVVVAFESTQSAFHGLDLILRSLKHGPVGNLLGLLFGFQRFNGCILLDEFGLKLTNTLSLLVELELKGLDFILELLRDSAQLT